MWDAELAKATYKTTLDKESPAKEFIAENRAGLVVSLGCGFDTRYWRVVDN